MTLNSLRFRPDINSFRHRRISTLATLLVAGLFATATANARVIRLLIERRESVPAIGQRSTSGPLERLTGHFLGELDPGDRHNAIINDIGLAPRNSHGMVEYSATFTLYRPADLSKAST